MTYSELGGTRVESRFKSYTAQFYVLLPGKPCTGEAVSSILTWDSSGKRIEISTWVASGFLRSPLTKNGEEMAW